MGTPIARPSCRNAFSWDLLPWNLHIRDSLHHGNGRDAVDLFKHMLSRSFLPDKVTLVSLLSACTKHPGFITQGKRLHAFIRQTEWDSDVVIGTALLTMYGKNGSIDDALRIFHLMPSRNIVTWNAILTTLLAHGRLECACKSFHQMLTHSIRPNRITILTLLDACSDHLKLDEGRWMHDCILRNNLHTDIVIMTSLLNMYGKFDQLEDAQRIFNMLEWHDAIMWSSLISLAVNQGCGKEARELFEQMKQEGSMPDIVTFVSALDGCAIETDVREGKSLHACIAHMDLKPENILLTSLMNMYGKCSDMENANIIFDVIEQPTVVSHNAMLAVCVHQENGNEAFQKFNNLQQESILPSSATFPIILYACAMNSTLHEGKRIHTLIRCSGFECDVIVETALVNMYGKSGNLETAYTTFEEMEMRNIITWTTIIASFAQNGEGLKAIQLFEQMQQEGMKPDGVTFVSILSACRHTGLVDEAFHWLNLMHKYGITPTEKHYECLIDLLGKVGRLDEAEELMKKLPYTPTVMTWTALLQSCMHQTDINRGERIANTVFSRDMDELAPYVILSKIYSVVGSNDDAQKSSVMK